MSKYFVRRGEKCIPLKYDGETIEITIHVCTNREHDNMMEMHTEYGQDGSVLMHGAELIEDRLVAFIVDLPFDIPKDVDMKEPFIKWKGATMDEKRLAVNFMESDLRDKINNAIAGIEEVDDKTAEN